MVAEEINTEGRERPEAPDDHQFGNLIGVGCRTAEEAAEFARSQGYDVRVEDAR